jgi:glycosyltransferase involved in cell wall biosynthesis
LGTTANYWESVTDQDTVSVVIPYYRALNTIARAVRSVLVQTIRPYEILVVDDGSTDDPAAALEEFGSAVTLIRKPNGGTASARNWGIEQAHGKWIAFLDADDYWEPFKLERQLAFSDGVGLLGGRWFAESPGKPRCVAEVPDIEFFGRMLKPLGSEAFRIAMNVWTGVLLVRRSALGDQRFVSGLEPAEDRELWIRLAASTTVYLIPEQLATYVQYENSLSNSDADRDCDSMLKVVHRHAALLGAKGVREQEAGIYRRWAGSHLARRKARFAIIPAARRLAIQPTSGHAWWIMAKALGQSILQNTFSSVFKNRSGARNATMMEDD